MRRLSLPLAALLVVPLLGSDAPRGYDGATVTDRLEEAWSEAVSFSLCPAAGPKRYGVSGEVRYKGKPLDHGGIIFLPESPTAGADSGGDNIKNGKYAIP